MFDAKQIATVKARAALSEPLIPKELPTEIAVEDERSQQDVNMPKTLGGILSTAAVCVLAAAGFAASAAAMVSVQSILVFVTGGICCLNAPTVIHRHYQINSLPNIRNSVGHLRKQMNELTGAVDFLMKTVDKLEDEVDDVKTIERELKSIADDQGANATELVELVKENEKIVQAIQHNLRESFVAEMAKVILRSDRDGDMKIEPEEGHLLALRLKIQLQPHGIHLDADRFQQVIEDDNDIAHILKFCAEVLYPEVSEKDKFEEDNKSVESSYDALSDEEDDFFPSDGQPASFATFCKKLSMMSEEELAEECGNVKMSKEDKLTMISVSNEYCRGSVAVARGSRLSIVPGANVQKKRYSRASNLVREANKRSYEVRKTMGRGEF